MKKIIYCLLLLLASANFTNAQLPDVKGKIIEKKTPGGEPLTPFITDLQLFERPGFTGRNGYFKWGADGTLVSPFPLTNVSFRIAEGKIVYIKKCTDEFPTESAFTSSQSKISLAGICGLRFDTQDDIFIQIDGISTSIHNNDCKRMYGRVSVKIFETPPDGAGTMAYMPCINTSSLRADMFTFRLFDVAGIGGVNRRSLVMIHNNSPALDLSTAIPGDPGRYTVGSSALRDGRVNISITTDLSGAHKTCDLCDDFSSNVRMPKPITETIAINRIPNITTDPATTSSRGRFIMGPYRARGSRDGSAITASAGTDKEYRVHLSALW